MSPLFTQLLQKQRELSENSDRQSCLIVLDENIRKEDIFGLAPGREVLIVTNRFDVNATAEQANILSHFSDFNFSSLNKTFEVCLFRIAKERAVNHHVFNRLQQVLSPNAHLIFGGKKNEGIKSYYQKLTKQYGCSGSIKKHGDDYVADIVFASHSFQLDDKDYSTLRKVNTFYSKPGLFGWDKIDSGSHFLIKTLIEEITCHHIETKQIIDLGCGYGYLSMELLRAAKTAPFKINKIHATDNNAAAIIAAEKNLKMEAEGLDTAIEVSADDCGSLITEKFDLLVCNPPFHQGFENDSGLSKKFVSNACERLKIGGLAYFVVNVFIPLEKLAKLKFSDATTIANNGKFKIIRAQR